jgi:DNA-binding response OmpR family regulator
MPLSNLKNVLHLEGEPLIAMDVAATLADAGVANVIHAMTCAEALALLETAEMDAAVLDVETVDGSTEPVAQRLREMGMPFVMYTALSKVTGAHAESAELLIKPVAAADLVEAIKAVLVQRH